MTDLFRQYCKDESGATSIEYALCASIVLTALVGIFATGGGVKILYQSLQAIVSGTS